MNGYLSLIVAVVGLGLYFLAKKPEIKETGRICFWVGLLAFLLANGSAVIGTMGR